MANALQMRGQVPEELLREETTRLAIGHLENLRSHLRGLEVIGTLAPLLGLLGTVLGMITAFQQMESAGSQVDPSILSGGIWEALLTTAVGLIVAIPVIMALNWLERVVDRFRHRMEDALTQVYTLGSRPVAPQRPELVAQQAHAH
jgi:biopolymer transport protein ExbB